MCKYSEGEERSSISIVILLIFSQENANESFSGSPTVTKRETNLNNYLLQENKEIHLDTSDSFAFLLPSLSISISFVFF